MGPVRLPTNNSSVAWMLPIHEMALGEDVERRPVS